MSIINNYIITKREHQDYFVSLSAKQRVSKENRDKILSAKHKIDSLEFEIISKIKDYTLKYRESYQELKNNNCHLFLEKSEEIKIFLSKENLADSIGYRREQRKEMIRRFEELCEKVWEDFIVTEEERIELDNFCQENKIDRIHQKLIENKIASKYHKNIDLEKVINHCIFEENKNVEEIQMILQNEYLLNIDIDRIKLFEEEQKLRVTQNEETRPGEYWTSFKIGTRMIYIVTIKNSLRSNYDFEIARLNTNKSTHPDLKVIVNQDKFNGLHTYQKIELVSDALAYLDAEDNLDDFLNNKRFLREAITRDSFSNFE